MTETNTMGPIGQISRQVRDIGAAVEWYRDVLGLRHLFTFGTFAFFDCHGVRLFLAAGEKEVGEPGDSTIYFRTEDIEAAHKRLTERGVTFLGAPHLIHRHESGVEEWMAFFKDLDGKILALMSQSETGTSRLESWIRRSRSSNRPRVAETQSIVVLSVTQGLCGPLYPPRRDQRFAGRPRSARRRCLVRPP